mgnify:CR=1 FL=1
MRAPKRSGRRFFSRAGRRASRPRPCARRRRSKAREEGLLAFCRARNIPLATYSAEELSQVEGSVSPSDFVRATVGVDNVCERAALADGGKLIFTKLAHGGVTVAFSKVTIELSFKER